MTKVCDTTHKISGYFSDLFHKKSDGATKR